MFKMMTNVDLCNKTWITILINFIATVLWTLSKERMDTRPKCGSNWRLMMFHKHQKGRKRFITHARRLSGESRTGFPTRSACVESKQGKESGVGFLWRLGWGWSEVPHVQVGAGVVWTSHRHQRRKHLSFLTNFPSGGVEEGDVRLDSCRQSNSNSADP